MSSASDPWREKYRKALLSQEKLESQLEQKQADVFQVALNLTQLAEGQDSALDERLKAIRVCARNKDAAGFERMLGGLERISKDSVQRGADRWKKTASALSSLAKQLSKHSSSDTKGQLKRWSARLGKAPLAPGLMAQQLTDLASIQAEVITGPSEEKAGLLSKLFGKSSQASGAMPTETPANSEQSASADSSIASDKPTAASSLEDPVAVEESTEKPESEVQDSLPKTLEATHNTGPAADADFTLALSSLRMAEVSTEVGNNNEGDFLALSPTISRIINELLAHFEPPVKCIEQKIINTRLRIEKGLTWQDLVPTLEDVRDLVMQGYLIADDEYRYYLETLDTELVKICDALGLAVDCGYKMNTAASTLQQTMGHQLQGLNQDLANHHQVDSLKQTVNDRIQHIEAALSKFSESHSSSLSLKLDEMVEQVRKMESDAKQAQQKLEVQQQRAVTDSLTELPNREAYQDRIFHEYSRWQRYERPLTLAVLDIDHFKRVNDNYGHQAGDRVLKVISRSVAKRLREVDFIARFGGEEFVMIFPETNAENTLKALNTIREALASASFTFKDQPVSITASFGIAEFMSGDGIDEVFARADEALYKAKASGRNRCVIGGVKSAK